MVESDVVTCKHFYFTEFCYEKLFQRKNMGIFFVFYFCLWNMLTKVTKAGLCSGSVWLPVEIDDCSCHWLCKKFYFMYCKSSYISSCCIYVVNARRDESPMLRELTYWSWRNLFLLYAYYYIAFLLCLSAFVKR